MGLGRDSAMVPGIVCASCSVGKLVVPTMKTYIMLISIRTSPSIYEHNKYCNFRKLSSSDFMLQFL